MPAQSKRSIMKKLIAVALLILSATAIAADQQGNRHNPNSYGSPQLYYSSEAMHEREEERALKEATQIERERLEIERQRLLQEEKRRRVDGYDLSR